MFSSAGKILSVMPAFFFPISICHFIKAWVIPSYFPFLFFCLWECVLLGHNQLQTRLAFHKSPFRELGHLYLHICILWISIPSDHWDHASFHSPILVPGIPEHTHWQAHCLKGLLVINIQVEEPTQDGWNEECFTVIAQGTLTSSSRLEGLVGWCIPSPSCLLCFSRGAKQHPNLRAWVKWNEELWGC